MRRKFFAALLMAALCVMMCTGAFAATSSAPSSIASAYEWNLLEQINEYRVENGQQPLSMLPALQSAAAARAIELDALADKNRPDGTGWATVLSEYSVSYSTATQCYMKGLTNASAAPAAIMNTLRNSSSDSVTPFREAVLNGNFSHIGIGSTSSGYWLWILTGGCFATECTVYSQDGSIYTQGADIGGLSMVAQTACSHGTATFPVSAALCTENAGSANLNYNTTSAATAALPTKAEEPTSITLNPTELVICKGTSSALTVSIAPTAAKATKLTWTSSNPAVASVASDGTVRGIKEGSATITVTDGSISATCTVTVVDRADSVSVSMNALTLGTGQKYAASYTLLPAGCTEKVTWSTYPGNSKAVTVSQDGVITAGTQTGKAYVIATTASGKSARIKVAVVASSEAVQSLRISATQAQVAPGGSIRLVAKAYPSTATNRTITWKSSNTSIATVNSSGIVTGMAKGEVTIYAIASSGISLSCDVTVRDVQVASVSFKKSVASIYVGQKGKLFPAVLPTNAAVKTLSWTSSDPEIATVDANGYVVAKAQGTVKITATASNGVSGSITLSVKEYPVSAVKISKRSATVSVGMTGTIRAQIAPSKASNTTVIWKSSNPSVVSVDENGKITALSSGTAVITATSESNPKAKASCTIRVLSNSYKRATAYTAGKASAWVTGAYFKGNELRVQVCYYNIKSSAVSGTAFGDEVLLYISNSVVLRTLEINSAQLYTGTVPARSAKYVVYTFSTADCPELASLNLRKLHSNSRVG